MPIAFTARELAIIRCIALGLRNRQVAEALGLRESTIRNYMQRIYDKTGMDTRVELAMWWLRHVDDYDNGTSTAGGAAKVDSHDQIDKVNTGNALGGPR